MAAKSGPVEFCKLLDLHSK